MKTYETKIEVLAKPMTAGEYNQEMGFQLRNAKGELYSEIETGYFILVIVKQMIGRTIKT